MPFLKSSFRRNFALFVLTTVSLNSAFAEQGGTSSGGGDIQCDALIKKISSNIEQWIDANGPSAGNLDLSSSLNPATGSPYTYSDYGSGMTAKLNLPLDVSCVGPGDSGYPVSVDDSAKICKNTVDAAGVRMVCNRGLFLALTADQQIEQVHHEFAIDVPGLETDTGPISTYKISDQLSADTGSVLERKLIVRAACPGNSSPCTTPDPLAPYRDLFNRSQPLDPNSLGKQQMLFWNHHDPLIDKNGQVYPGDFNSFALDTTGVVPKASVSVGSPDDGMLKVWCKNNGIDNTSCATFTFPSYDSNGLFILGERGRLTWAPEWIKDTDGEFRTYPSATLRLTFHSNDTNIFIKVELCDNGVWTETDYLVLNITRDRILDFTKPNLNL